ncbi:META domain-containing protein [Paeniglutamicibacter psychrophenolicus]|uniref:META domain-containing protein n=1 Tax=Paeniglutamicibacter psychrophenolicus TaxID=257454 RepID=UPI002781E64E|nr:META domain-containing protein [Paeniglutamicibacter psychrophenolicus]MDQ0095879.1 heat shock protein HslJ [Paeniglutamicibacter psychrophenolicus]
MKRSPALVAAAALALALAGCAGAPGAPAPESTAASVSLRLDIVGPTDGSGGPKAVRPTAMPAPTAVPPVPPSGPVAAAVSGQWGGATEGSPVLWFSDTGGFNGNDGCNSLAGSWVVEGARIELKDTIMTLVACLGMDTWLSSAAAVRVKGDTLHVTDAAGREIGTLPRLNVGY